MEKKSIQLKPEVFFKPQKSNNRPKGQGINPFLSNKKSVKDSPPVLYHRWSPSQKAADFLTSKMGSWGFIFFFFIFLIAWMLINVLMLVNRWAPYPFILLNLVLSCLAAIQAPIILMSQNRENQKDRLRAQYDYNVDKKAEKEIREIKEMLLRIEKKMK